MFAEYVVARAWKGFCERRLSGLTLGSSDKYDFHVGWYGLGYFGTLPAVY
jgi:hypothetical protein